VAFSFQTGKGEMGFPSEKKRWIRNSIKIKRKTGFKEWISVLSGRRKKKASRKIMVLIPMHVSGTALNMMRLKMIVVPIFTLGSRR
jgi:hypothetical protein